MTSFQQILLELNNNLKILRKRKAKFASKSSFDLLNQIADHQQAITLTKQVLQGKITEAKWHELLQPLLVAIQKRTGDAAVNLTINTGGGAYQVNQTATGSYIAQAASGGIANVTVTQAPEERPFWRRLSRANLILAIILGLIATTATVLAVPGVSDVVYSWFTPLPVTPAADGESLILITNFHQTTANKTEPHIKIKRAIEDAAKEAGLDILRVGIEPTILTADQQEEAEALGEQYNAEMIIWGEDTGVQVLVNFYNLKQPDFDAAAVRIDEDERTQLINPSAYTKFILHDLPDQLTFLAFFALGQSLYSNGQYSQSKDVIEYGIASIKEQNRPQGLAEAYSRLGWIYQLPPFKDYNKAIINYNQALELNPNEPSTYNNRGVNFYKIGEFDRALEDYERVIELSPNNPIVYNNRGIAFFDSGNPEQAIIDFDRAIQINPNYVTAHYNRGNYYHIKGDLKAAIEEFTEAIQSDPNFYPAYTNRGIVLANLGNYKDAITDYSTAIKINPNDASIYTNRGEAFAKLADNDAALADHSKAIQLDPYLAQAYSNRGTVYTDLGNYEAAIADYSQAVAIDPQLAAVFYNRGIAYEHQGKFNDAIADYSQAIQLDPQMTIAYDNRGFALASLGLFDDAISDFDKILQLDPNNAQAYSSRGIVLAQQGNLDDAIANFTKAIELSPGDILAYHNRGLAFLIQDDFEAAIADFSKVIQLNPHEAIPFYNRGEVYVELGDVEKAILDFEAGLQVDGDPIRRKEKEEKLAQLKAKLENP